MEVVADVGGLHAQLMSSAELEAWVRVKGARPDDIRSALWEERTLAKTWLMRSTLHVVLAEDLAMMCAAIGTSRLRTTYFLKHVGVTAKELDRVIETIGMVLDDGELRTGTELTAEVERRIRNRSKRPDPAWGWFLRIAGLSGQLCYGPNRGGSATFTRPQSWLPSWRSWTPEEARIQLLRRYLRAHGPAGREDFAWWLNMIPPSQVNDAWSAVEGEVEEIEPGRFVLRDDAKRLASKVTCDRVRLLPSFDAALLGHKDRSHIVDQERYATIYRKAAWVTPALLVDGRVRGIWSHEVKSKRVGVTVEPFAKLDRPTHELVATEADSLGAFLGAPAEVDFL